MVRRENELRRSEEWQERFAAAERRADTDWLDCVEELQLQVVREFRFPDSAVKALRCARELHPDEAFFREEPLCVRFNRSRNGPLTEGSLVPPVRLHDLDGSSVLLQDFGGQPGAQPLVIVAGSFS